MRLLTVPYLRDRLGELDYADVNAMLESALTLITHPLESLVRTKFARGTYTDVFRVDNLSSNLLREYTGLRLYRGLVDTEGSLEIRQTTVLTELSTAPLTEVDYVVSHEGGTIIFDELLPRCWLSVTYTSGIEVADEVYDAAQTPQWLKDAAVIYASAVYSRLVAEKNRDKDKALRGDPGSFIAMPPEVRAVVGAHIRWYPDHYSPEYTT